MTPRGQMKNKEQIAEYPVRDGLKQLMQPGSLGAAAIVGYTFFLPLDTHPDLATFVLVALGLLAIFFRQSLRPRLERIDYIVILLVIVATGISTLKLVTTMAKQY